MGRTNATLKRKILTEVPTGAWYSAADIASRIGYHATSRAVPRAMKELGADVHKGPVCKYRLQRR